MLNKALLSALLFFSLAGCAVYGDSYDRGYYHEQRYRYHDGYRRDHYSPPVYVVPRYYYEDRRHDYRHEPRRYVPAPPPRYHGYRQQYHNQGWRDDRQRIQQHREYRDQRRHEQRNSQPNRGWGDSRGVQQRYSQGRENDNRQRGGERRW